MIGLGIGGEIPGGIGFSGEIFSVVNGFWVVMQFGLRAKPVEREIHRYA